MRLLLLPMSVLSTVAAHAQDVEGGIDAHGFVLSAQDGDVRDGLAIHRPGSLSKAGWHLGGVVEYAHRPLVLILPTGDDREIEPALSDLVVVNLGGGWTPTERLRFNATLPLVLTSKGLDGRAGPALGDARIDAMALLVDPDDNNGIGVGLVPWIDLPTGATRRYLGRRTVGAGGVLAGTYEADGYTLSGNLGLQGEPGVEVLNLQGGVGFVGAISGNVLLDERSSLGLEARVQAPASKNIRAGTGTPSEVLLSYRRRADSGAWLVGGLGAPLSPGAGAALFRAFIGGGFGRIGPAPTRDRDLDGIADDLDACPTEPETVNGYIDEDGCPDSLSELVVEVSWKGAPAPEARLSVEGKDGVETARLDDAASHSRQVPPDSMWSLTATQGACLRGEAKQLVDSERAVAKVELELVPSATIRLTVKDEKGNPVPGAQFTWEGEDLDCVPEPPALDSTGRAMINVGAGDHRLVVGAPGYRFTEVPASVANGDDIPIDVVLTKTKLKVEKSRIVILEKVNFELNKATIKSNSYELLDEVADVIRRNPEAGRVEVQGHTDAQGSESYNLDLSQRRAEAVRAYLVDKGVDRKRLIAVGFGESKPIAPNNTRAGRAENRRVEFILIDQAEQTITEPAP